VASHAARNRCRADQQLNRQLSMAGKAQPALAGPRRGPTTNRQDPLVRLLDTGPLPGRRRGRATAGTPQVQQPPAPPRLLLGLCFQVHFGHYQQGSRIVPSILADPRCHRRPLPAQWSRPIWFDACSVLARMRRYRLVAAVLLWHSLHMSWTYLRGYGREGAGNSGEPWNTAADS